MLQQTRPLLALNSKLDDQKLIRRFFPDTLKIPSLFWTNLLPFTSTYTWNQKILIEKIRQLFWKYFRIQRNITRSVTKSQFSKKLPCVKFWANREISYNWCINWEGNRKRFYHKSTILNSNNSNNPQLIYLRNRKIQKTEYHNLGLSNIDVHDSEEVLSPNFGQKT